MNYSVMGIFFVLALSSITPVVYAQEIPQWVKSNAGWWAGEVIEDQEFVLSIQFLINEQILIIPPTAISNEKSEGIPEWVKSNAGWWADEVITDDEFVNSIQYLIANGILSVEVQSEIETETEIYTASGKFSDGDFIHRTSGVASVEYVEGLGGTLYFDQRFNTVLGPDLFVYLATDKSASDFVDVGRLQSSSGEQSYTIPANTDLAKYNNVLVWCKSFGVLFGNANIS